MILVIGGAFQGKGDFVKTELGIEESRALFDYHKKTKEWLSLGLTADEMTKRALDGNYEAIVCDEIGLGIVPMDRSDRDWREETGRSLCALAKKAEAVYRVVCGIGSRIK